MITTALLLGLSILVAAVGPWAEAGEKYALVVGVEAYIPTELPSLKFATPASRVVNVGFRVVCEFE